MSDNGYEAFIYRNKLNTKTLIDLLPILSDDTFNLIIKDINRSCPQKETLYIFTDGGCFRNGQSGSKGAYSVLFSDDKKSPFYKFNKTEMILREPTNNKAELSAIEYALETVLENYKLFYNKSIVICTDSMYCINCIGKWSKNWLKNDWKNSKGETVTEIQRGNTFSTRVFTYRRTRR